MKHDEYNNIVRDEDFFKAEKLWKLCKKFVDENDIVDDEFDMYKTNLISENAIELIEEICKIVGYKHVERD